jgi:lipopolysaccharide export system permease protein
MAPGPAAARRLNPLFGMFNRFLPPLFGRFALSQPFCAPIKGYSVGIGGRRVGTRRSPLGDAGEQMGSIGRYIFRTTFGAFLLVLVSLTALIWVTQALRDIDLMTNQGQTILAFIGITSLIIPLLLLVIAPIALLIAVAYVLNKLGTDSEIIVMNASGMSPWRLFRAFLAVAGVVALGVAVTSAYLSPKGLRELRRSLTEVRADFVTNIVQPGRFTTIEGGLTISIRERQPNGLLLGIFVDDRRDPKERATVIAEQGEILENQRGTFLILQTGSVQRHEADQRDPTIVTFDRYAFDLSRFAGIPAIKYSSRELYLWELLFPPADDPLQKNEPGQFRAELHDRLVAPLYPLAFVVIAYAYLGAPRTTRQSRAMSLVGAIGGVALLRLIGFASIILSVHMPAALLAQYAALALAFGLGCYAISRGLIIEPPAFINDAITAVVQRLTWRTAKT